MDAVLDFGLEVTRWLQGTFPQLADFFVFLAYLGEAEFYLALFPLVFWCIDKRFGQHLAYVFALAVATNSLFKPLFRGPRPYWIDNSIALIGRVGYGVPSGHAQITAVIYPFFAYWFKKRWVTVGAIFMVIAMSISRVYTGSHFVHDVIGGLILAGFHFLGYWVWQKRLSSKLANRILGQKLLVVVAIPLTIALLYGLSQWILGEPDLTGPWAEQIELAEKEGIESVFTSVGVLLGIGVGILFETSRIRFKVDGPIWQRALRYLIGMVVAGGIWYGLGKVFPDEPLWIAMPLRVLRYFLTTIWVTYYGPYFFVKVKLATAEPDPGIQISLRSDSGQGTT